MPEVSYKVCCPVCGHGRSHVTNVRHGEIEERAVTTYRRRQCLGCTALYDTESTERVTRIHRPRVVTFHVSLSATSSNTSA